MISIVWMICKLKKKAASLSIILLMPCVWVNAQQQMVSSQRAVIESRVKDIASLDGMQDNVIFGYGLVAGLNGTGDGRQGFTRQSLANVLKFMKVNVRADQVIPDNVAAVWVEATIPPFARPGSKINARVTSLGQAQSLEGGVLLATPLKGYDQKIHGIAQGPVSLGGGFRVETGGGGGAGAGSATVQQNHALVGLIPNGVIIEGKMIQHDVLQEGSTLRWLLHTRDFKTASTLQQEINGIVQSNVAVAEDAGAVKVFVGMDREGKIVLGTNPNAWKKFQSLVDLIAYVEDLEIPTDERAKIVINERTGSVVAGRDIKVRPVMVAHGPLRITIQNTPEVTPGDGFGAPATTVNQANATANTGDKVKVIEGTTVGDVVASLNEVGFTPRDLIAIFQLMAEAGAIKADLVIQ